MKTKGFSLIELMVAMVVGLFVAGIVATMYVSIIRANSTTVQLSRLNQDLQSTMDIIARDIQRSGYDADSAQNLARNTSGAHITSAGVATTSDTEAVFYAFQIVSGAMTTTPQDYNSVANCILLRYDANDDGVVGGATSQPEIMAYRYAAASSAVEYQSWTSVASQSCTGTGWQTLAGGDGHLNVNNLTFTLKPASGASPSFGQRSIVVAISGSSATDPALSVTLSREVRLRNDQFQ